MNTLVMVLALCFGAASPEHEPTPPPVEPIPAEPAPRTSPAADPGEKPAMRELLPGVRVGEGRVEFEGTVCADASHPQTPIVYLELLVTGPDSREHESLVVTTVKPSVIHAGLLAAGLEPGHPISWRGAKVDKRPEGPRVRVEAAVVGEDGPGPFVDLASWAVHQETKEHLDEVDTWGLVFAGSRTDDRGYAADGTGTIIGLAGFGTEVVAAAWGLSPQAAVDEPVWIVDKDRVPPFGARVIVRVSEIEDPEKPAEDAPDPS